MHQVKRSASAKRESLGRILSSPDASFFVHCDQEQQNRATVARLSSFITPEGSKIIQIKHLKHKTTQQYIQVKTIKTPLKHHIKVQNITDEPKLHHTDGSQIRQKKHTKLKTICHACSPITSTFLCRFEYSRRPNRDALKLSN